MKTEKMTLKGVKNVLSRSELKKIMAGSGNCIVEGSTCFGSSGLPCCTGTCQASNLGLRCL